MGKYYKGTGWSAEQIGSVDDDGKVYRGTGWSAEQIGSVDDDGKVYRGTGWGKDTVGKVEAPRLRATGAAYLLLWYL